MATTETFIGQPVLRKEDPELLTGHASYIDNWTMPGMVWMALARPPYVHATIDGVDTAEAESMPGVVGVYTAADFEFAPLPFVWPITEEIKVPVHYPLASDKVRFNGDAVAVVLAETREQALDAAEAVAVTATELPAVIDIEEAAKDEVDRARRPRDERRRALESWGRRRPVRLRLGAGDRAGAIRPAAADPERDRAAWLSRVRRAARGRVDAGHRDPDPAHRQGHARRDHRDRRAQAADHRSGRGRRIRIEAERVRGGGPRAGPGPEAPPAGEVDRGPARELRGHDPRSRRPP